MRRTGAGKRKGSNGKKRHVEEVDEDEEIAELQEKYQVMETENPPGSQHPNTTSLKFEDMALSSKTKRGLADEGMVTATDIQAAALMHGLLRRDILGAAKTGSGKTLAFVIPLLERLFMEKWCSEDGLAALIITPTRELAMQIFDVLRKIGRHHPFSAGMITGGKKEFEEEQLRVVSMNILVATPGRLLQHLEVTPGFDASQLLLLVLDEADRILDMGFRTQLDGILDYLPPRQTLLFSATQTKSVKDLARLSLAHPEYLAVHSSDEQVTPASLTQNYIVCHLDQKLDTLYTFLKTHLTSKIIVFFSTCSQVRFVFETFRSMQPGITLCALHGKIKQERRTLIYMDFARRASSCLFATDIAARGLDFPNVDWVVQVDAPEDNAMYIHRVGRTARYNAGGRALLLLMPSEEFPVTSALKAAGVPIKKLSMNKNQTFSVAQKAAALLVSRPECRELAKKAFTGYLKALQLLPDRERMNVSALNLDGFARSLGLAFTPPVPAVAAGGSEGREQVREAKNVNRKLDKLKKQIQEAKAAKKREADGQVEDSVAAEARPAKKAKASSGEEDLFVVKAVHNWATEPAMEETVAVAGGTKKSKLKIGADGRAKAVAGVVGQRVLFDENDEAVAPFRYEVRPVDESVVVDKGRIHEYMETVKRRVDEGRKEDLARERERVQKKHKDQRAQKKGPRQEQDDEEDGGVVLRSPVDEDEDDSHEERYDTDQGDDDDEEEEAEEEEVDEGTLRRREALAMQLLASKSKFSK